MSEIRGINEKLMAKNTPYKNWTRNQLFEHFEKQCIEYGIDIGLTHKAVFENSWNPLLDFNGCNFVQDNLHPFLPCFIHDWRWVCFDYSNKWDLEFRDNLRKFGYSKFKSTIYYFAVRIGSVYFKMFK